ncbi:MAG: 30S ribosomal protein S6 [Patescibacteria group bacterium]
METQSDSRNYELAYHLNPDIEETEIKTRAEELEAVITQSGALILTVREPKRKHLSYPLHHKKYAYFGVLDFSAGPETLEKINVQLKFQNSLLRYLLIKKEQADKELRVLGGERPRPKMRTHEPSVPGRETPAPEVKPEQMEKEIEEVLGKI